MLDEDFNKVFPNLTLYGESIVVIEFKEVELNHKFGTGLFSLPKNAEVLYEGSKSFSAENINISTIES